MTSPKRINPVKPSAAFPIAQMPLTMHALGYLSCKGAIKYDVSPCEMREMAFDEFEEKALRHHNRSKVEIIDADTLAPHIVAAAWNYNAYVQIMLKYDPAHVDWFKTTDFFTEE